MESNTMEALKAKADAEKLFVQKDFVGAKNYCLKAQKLCPELEGISQMVATFGVYVAAEAKINGELDFYSILGLDASANKSKLKKQYKKMAVLLHPDKNKTVGAEGAFKLVSEAWTLLSDGVARCSYEQRRNFFVGDTSAAGNYNSPKFSASHSRLDSFWTVCTSCHVQYEYLRKYVNKRLSCKNCRCVFIAVETGLAPVDGSFPYCTYSCGSENGYGSYNYGVSYPPTTTGYSAPNGASGHHSGYSSEYVSNISFQGNPAVNSMDIFDSNRLPSSSFLFYQSNGKVNKNKENGKHQMVKPATSHVDRNGYAAHDDAPKPKRGRPSKKRKMDEVTPSDEHKENSPKISVDSKTSNTNGNLKPTKLSCLSEASHRRSLSAPGFDARQFLIDKARTVILKKLEEMEIAEENEKRNALIGAEKSIEATKVPGSAGAGCRPELKRSVSMSITVPDSDFHDFDKDRSEECFKPKQIWALYDEEDGMPRLYCLIREVLSVKPFKSYISYLSSKSDSEFGSVNWLDSGFTKSCGSFRVFSSEKVEQVNIFSHLLSREKAGRGGCVRIYPRCGDIWAVYRNWSPNWNRNTPDEVRHQYEMVEVLDDYSEEHGVWVTPLVKLDGFKTVYKRKASSDDFLYIPRREMLRFSHQVPSCSLRVDGANLPEGCWDLDPAAIPDELLQGETEPHIKASLSGMKKTGEISDEQFPVEPKEINVNENFVSVPAKESEVATKPCIETSYEQFPVESKVLYQRGNLVPFPETESEVAGEVFMETSYEQFSAESKGLNQSGIFVLTPEKEYKAASKPYMGKMIHADEFSCREERAPMDISHEDNVIRIAADHRPSDSKTK